MSTRGSSSFIDPTGGAVANPLASFLQSQRMVEAATRDFLQMHRQGESAFRFLNALQNDFEYTRRGFVNMLKASEDTRRQIAAVAKVSLAGISEISQSVLIAKQSLAAAARISSDFKTVSSRFTESLASDLRSASAMRDAFVTQIERFSQVGELLNGATVSVHVLERLRSKLEAVNVNTLEELAASLEARDNEFADLDEEGETLDSATLEAADALFTEVIATPAFQSASDAEKLNYIFEHIKQQPTWLQARLTSIMDNLVASFLWMVLGAAISFTVVHSGVLSEKQSADRSIAIVREAEFSENFIDITRIVVRQSNVTQEPGKRKRRVATLPAGTVVVVLQKTGKWVEIEWMDVDSEQAKTGWLRSKLLRKVANSP